MREISAKDFHYVRIRSFPDRRVVQRQDISYQHACRPPAPGRLFCTHAIPRVWRTGMEVAIEALAQLDRTCALVRDRSARRRCVNQPDSVTTHHLLLGAYLTMD